MPLKVDYSKKYQKETERIKKHQELQEDLKKRKQQYLKEKEEQKDQPAVEWIGAAKEAVAVQSENTPAGEDLNPFSKP